MGPEYTDTKNKLFYDTYLHLCSKIAMKTIRKK